MSTNTVVLITGANTGIGYETARALLRSHTPYYILLGSRSVQKGGNAAQQLRAEYPSSLSTVEVLCADISSDDSINSAFEVVKKSHGRVDVLVNNGGNHDRKPADTQDIGIALNGKIASGELSTRSAFNDMFNTNVTGTHVMTDVFTPLLLSSADPRLLFLTSGLAQIQVLAESPSDADRSGPTAGVPSSAPAPAGPTGYRTSKVAINMIMLTWKLALEGRAVKVWGVSPGILATGLGGDKEFFKAIGAADPSIGGELIRRIIEGEKDGDVGKVVGQDGVQPW